MLKKFFSGLFGSQTETPPSPRGTVKKVCPQCRQPSPVPVRTCQCGYEFPASSTALPEYASAQELLAHAARQGLDANVSVQQVAPSPGLAIRVSTGELSQRKQRPPKPSTVVGRLTHTKTYRFGVNNYGETTTSCHVCLDPHYVLSIATDSAGTKHRCCLRCLRKFGGQEQLERAISRSGYAAVVWECMEALDQLLAEFPDPTRRPYGEKTLRDTIKCPILQNPDRIISKIKSRSWTEYDLARIEGRPEPPSKAGNASSG